MESGGFSPMICQRNGALQDSARIKAPGYARQRLGVRLSSAALRGRSSFPSRQAKAPEAWRTPGRCACIKAPGYARQRLGVRLSSAALRGRNSFRPRQAKAPEAWRARTRRPFREEFRRRTDCR